MLIYYFTKTIKTNDLGLIGVKKLLVFHNTKNFPQQVVRGVSYFEVPYIEVPYIKGVPYTELLVCSTH